MAVLDTPFTGFGPASLPTRLIGQLTAFSVAMLDRYNARLCRSELDRLTDRELADIGLIRSDIDRITNTR